MFDRITFEDMPQALLYGAALASDQLHPFAQSIR
jgi:hypothetical protein